VTAALADLPEESPEPVELTSEVRELKSEVLLSIDGLENSERPWIPSNFHLHGKSGFAFTHRAEFADRPLIFRLQGPVLRRQKALGLTFKVRF
jgi:hypothetical protein